MGIASVLWRVFSTLEDNISTCEDNISTVGDNISTVEGIHYSGEIPSVQWGITSVLLGLLSTVEIKI